MKFNSQLEQINFKRINCDVNGNPRYVCHFLKLSNNYDEALKIAKKAGGRKFHNKQYGGGIAFTTYNLDEIKEFILANKVN